MWHCTSFLLLTSWICIYAMLSKNYDTRYRCQIITPNTDQSKQYVKGITILQGWCEVEHEKGNLLQNVIPRMTTVWYLPYHLNLHGSGRHLVSYLFPNIREMFLAYYTTYMMYICLTNTMWTMFHLFCHCAIPFGAGSNLLNTCMLAFWCKFH